MISALRHIFRKSHQRAPRVPDGTRYYVIGDIHGCRNLFETLADAIDRDDRERPPADTTIVLLGDLIDRGPDSASVLDSARRWQERRHVRMLAGNHEDMFLQCFQDIDILKSFLKYGGRETLLSYGLERARYNSMSLEDLFDELPRIVPQDDRDFMAQFEECIVAGDYLFAHAGVDLTRPALDQSRRDLLWIRNRFLDHDGPYSHVVVHGHTIFDRVEHRGHRIGIDTGAYSSGRLTSLVLEGSSQRSIAAVRRNETIEIETEEYHR